MTKTRIDQPTLFAQQVEAAFGRATRKAGARLQAAGAPHEGDDPKSLPMEPVALSLRGVRAPLGSINQKSTSSKGDKNKGPARGQSKPRRTAVAGGS